MSEKANPPEPVTVAFTRAIRPGKVAEFEACVAGIAGAAGECPGYLGTNIIRPCGGARPEYTVVIRFETPPRLKAWEEAEVRAEWVARLDALPLGQMRQARSEGLEYWFTPSGQAAPPRWKMALLTWAALLPLVYWIPPAIVRVWQAPHPIVQAGLQGFGDSSIDLAVRYWLPTRRYFEGRGKRKPLHLARVVRGRHHDSVPAPRRTPAQGRLGDLALARRNKAVAAKPAGERAALQGGGSDLVPEAAAQKECGGAHARDDLGFHNTRGYFREQAQQPAIGFMPVFIKVDHEAQLAGRGIGEAIEVFPVTDTRPIDGEVALETAKPQVEPAREFDAQRSEQVQEFHRRGRREPGHFGVEPVDAVSANVGTMAVACIVPDPGRAKAIA